MAPVGLCLIAVIFGTWISLTSGESVISCTFDDGLCKWHPKQSSNLQWNLHSGQTDDRTSGPLNDHTCNNEKGQYIYVTGGSAKGKDDSADIESDTIDILNATQLEFWYMMNGFGTGNLTLYRSDGQKTAVIWSKSGRQGRMWIKDSVRLETGRFVLRFEATVRLPIGSDLALDDIQLMSESQYVNKSHCIIPTTTNPTTTTVQTTSTSTPVKPSTTKLTSRSTSSVRMPVTTKRTTHSPLRTTTQAPLSTCINNIIDSIELPGTCDFETDMCGIKIIASKNDTRVTWNRTNQQHGRRRVKAEFIEGDHTHIQNNASANGYYMDYQKGGGWFWQRPHDIAVLEIPKILYGNVCVTFWYTLPHTYSNLEVRVKDNIGHTKRIWYNDIEKLGKVLPGWHEASLSLTENPPYTIIFQSVNTNYMAVAGLDDIRILASNVSVKYIEPTSPIPASTSPLATTNPSLTSHTSSPNTSTLPTSSRATVTEQTSTVTETNIATDQPVTSTVTVPEQTHTETIHAETPIIITTKTPSGPKATSTTTTTTTTTTTPIASNNQTTKSYAQTYSTVKSTSLLKTHIPTIITTITTSEPNSTSIVFNNKTTKSYSPTNSIVKSTSPLKTSTNPSRSYSTHIQTGTTLNVTNPFINTTHTIAGTTLKPTEQTKKPNVPTKKPSDPTKKPVKTISEEDGKTDKQSTGNNNSNHDDNLGEIIGFSVGGVLALLFIVVVVFMIHKLRRNKQHTTEPKYSSSEEQMKEIGDHFESHSNGHTNNWRNNLAMYDNFGADIENGTLVSPIYANTGFHKHGIQGCDGLQTTMKNSDVQITHL